MAKIDTQHTPGPWDFDGISPEEAMFIVAPDRSGRWRDIYIAEIALKDDEGRFAPTRAERNANARLIAAAPNMLAALEAARDELECYQAGNAHDEATNAALATVCAAIDKAKSQINTNHFTTADADRLLGLADQFLESWAEDAIQSGKRDQDYEERNDEWQAIRPMLVAAPELLDALNGALYALDENMDGAGPSKETVIKQARNALAKARRQS